MATIRLPNRWEPRPYQRKLWSYLEGGGKRADVVWHRRAGKDDVALNWAAVAAFQRTGTYWHMLPEAAQARKAIWDAIDPHSGRRRIDVAFPRELRESTRENDMLIRFKNGSTWQVMGSDNYDSLVGSPPVGIVFSEWALAKAEAWTYTRPILAENGGWVVKIWTPRGRNHATRSFEARELDDEWLTQRLPATQTSVFTPEQLARERDEMIRDCGSEEEGDAKYRQEYLVDFDAAVPGSYYGSHMSNAKLDGRIGLFPYDPTLGVITAWDIGVDDYTAVWFLQENGREVRAIDYYETSGEGADAIVGAALPELLPDPEESKRALEERGRPAYRYTRHHFPHDVMVREWGAGGKSRFETLHKLGVKPIMVGAQLGPAERINATRRLLPMVSFDRERCSVGLDRMRNYRRNWNKSLAVYTGPVHDENSHGADAFGEFAVNCHIAPAKPVVPSRNPPDLWGRQNAIANGWKIA